MLPRCTLPLALLGFLTLLRYAEAQEILCPQHRCCKGGEFFISKASSHTLKKEHLEGEVQKCKELLPDLSGKKEKLAALSIRYGLRCAREVDPDISLPDIRERRCKKDDPQDFPRKTRIGFSGDELDRFRGAAAILSCLAVLAPAQIQLCPHHGHLSEELRNCQGPELTNNEAFNTLSEFSKRYEEYCAHKMAPGMSVAELHVHRCADKQFNSMVLGGHAKCRLYIEQCSPGEHDDYDEEKEVTTCQGYSQESDCQMVLEADGCRRCHCPRACPSIYCGLRCRRVLRSGACPYCDCRRGKQVYVLGNKP
ncbi:hypothetical protein HPB50_027089 [Hyalomma asiaticum]|uniref:Uncharacterized protein n=1 Tax=Hyalomma asiaticum TaxID=266040 RepID=A0ACB7RX79_HYAAI|nr:hypothetical protein HPB50_027089 [Hyalomma asiaticum]